MKESTPCNVEPKIWRSDTMGRIDFHHRTPAPKNVHENKRKIKISNLFVIERQCKNAKWGESIIE